MHLVLSAGQKDLDLKPVFYRNTYAFTQLNRPHFILDKAREQIPIRNWNAANGFLSDLRAAEERIKHTIVLLVTVLNEVNEYLNQCTDLDEKECGFLKELFSPDTVKFIQAPNIRNGWLYQAIRDRLTSRSALLEQLLSEIRSYNDVIRRIHIYYSQNLQRKFERGTYIDGFLPKDDLPVEISIG